MTKSTLAVLPPLLFAAAAWGAGVNWLGTLRVLVTAFCLYCAFMSAWWIRNESILYTIIPLSTSGAENLYLSNNPRNAEAGIDWSTDVEPNAVARIRTLPSEIERERAFNKQALD